MLFDIPVVLRASCAAVELRKYSVPLFSVAKSTAPGDWDGARAKPGIGLDPARSARFSIATMCVLLAPAERAFFENAYSCAPLKLLPKTPGSPDHGYSLV